MNRCTEFVLDDAMAITAIPTGVYTPGTLAWQLKKTIGEDSFSPTLLHVVTIGIQPALEGGTLIPIRHMTGKAKDDESDDTAGRLHTVTVTCEVDDRDSEVWETLLTLERIPAHLLLTFRDGTRAFVQATDDTYQCQIERDGAKTSVTFRIQDTMGIQLIVPQA